MSQTVQTRDNHSRLDPVFHFFLVPITFALLVWAGISHFRLKTLESFFVSAGFLVMLVAIFEIRRYSLRVQDRLIRLEERLRLEALCEEAFWSRIPEFTIKQLVALRFASDAELPDLAKRVLDEKMHPKQIKAAIQNWRGDYFRV